MEKIMKKRDILLIAAAAVLILIAGSVIAEEPTRPGLKRAVIKIDSLSCGGCFATINAGLLELEGYSGMGANLFRKLIAVDYSEPLTPEEISKKLTEVGYPGEVEAVEAISEKESFAYLESKRTRFSGAGGCGFGGGGCAAGSPPAGAAPQSGGSCCDLPGTANPAKTL